MGRLVDSLANIRLAKLVLSYFIGASVTKEKVTRTNNSDQPFQSRTKFVANFAPKYFSTLFVSCLENFSSSFNELNMCSLKFVRISM
jgi:hypothetical protein